MKALLQVQGRPAHPGHGGVGRGLLLDTTKRIPEKASSRGAFFLPAQVRQSRHRQSAPYRRKSRSPPCPRRRLGQCAENRGNPEVGTPDGRHGIAPEIMSIGR